MTEKLHRSTLHGNIHFKDYTNGTHGALAEAHRHWYGASWSLVIREHADQSHSQSCEIWYVRSIGPTEPPEHLVDYDERERGKMDIFIRGFLAGRRNEKQE